MKDLIPSNVKKFKTKKDYISACKDGILFGKRDKTGRHLTLIQRSGRLTMHVTDPAEGWRKNIFSTENSKENEKLWKQQFKELKELILNYSIKKKPKWVYVIPKSALRLDFIPSKNGKENIAIFPSESKLLHSIAKMSFIDFSTSDCFVGVTRAGSIVLRTDNDTIILSRKAMKKIERAIANIPFFAAIEMGK